MLPEVRDLDLGAAGTRFLVYLKISSESRVGALGGVASSPTLLYTKTMARGAEASREGS